VTALVTATALAAGVGPRTAVLAAAILTGQASIGWANDYVDAERDRVVARPDKPVATGDVAAATVGAAAAAALTLSVPLSLAIGWRPGAAHLVAVGSGWLYDLRLKQTWASWAPYALSFGLLPVIIAGALPGAPRPQPLIVGVAACLGVAAHFANTVGDADDDAATGVRGLPQRLGPRVAIAVAATVVVAAAALMVAATRASAASTAAAAVAVAALPLALIRPRRRHTAFGAVIAAAGALVVAFVAAGGDHLLRR
jgi:4-hydroxybenzoate polyprenyltransferase